MDKFGEKPKSNALVGTRHINRIPAEIVGRFLQHLSVADRRECEGVSPRWNRALSKMGWTEQVKLNRDIVFEGKSDGEIERFWENASEKGVCKLFVSLFNCVSQTLVELDLHSFGAENLEHFVHKFGKFGKIAKSIHRCSKLERINIQSFNLRDFVVHLPGALRDLKTSKWISVSNLQTLSCRCPNLEDVPFKHLHYRYYQSGNLNLSDLIGLIGKFPRQKRLRFSDFQLTSGKPGPDGFYSSIGRLNELVKLELHLCSSVDGVSFGAIVEGCQNLEFLSLDAGHLTEQTLFLLVKIQKLSTLELNDPEEQFSDAVLKAIAQLGQLKKLSLGLFEQGSPITDDAIVYLVDRCKSLVSLSFVNCDQITERSLKAVVAEVERRHGAPPRSLPSGPRDPGIFYYTKFDPELYDEEEDENNSSDGEDVEDFADEEEDEDSADEEGLDLGGSVEELIGDDDNPWLRVNTYDEPNSDDED